MQDITARETKLVDITKQRASWYSLLVHLGTKTMPGVWLDGAAFHANGRLQLSGKAVDYDALAQFLSLLEQDKEIAGMKPGLERSALSQDGQLTSFAVDLGKEEQSE
jgi:Tfp pilus assembly protein PilN